MKLWRLLSLMLVMPVCLFGDTGSPSTNVTAETILASVQSNRPMKDFSLKARLFVDRDTIVPVDIFMKNTPAELRTIYRSGATQLLVVQPTNSPARFFLAGKGELTGKQRTEKFLGSEFSYYDLGTPFLRWPHPKLIGMTRTRGQDCYLIDVLAKNEPYPRVQLWVHAQFMALLRADALDADGNLIKRFSITSLKRIGDVYVPHGIEMMSKPLGQSLPAAEKSRLEIYDGNYDTKLPAEMFAEEKFGARP